MRPVIWFLLLFVLAVAITLLARFDAGYVVVVLPPWRLEMSFMLAAVAMLMVFGIGYFGVRMVRLALRLPADVRAWHHRRRSDKAEDELSRAMAAYLAGQMAEARTLADSALQHEHVPLSALLAAHAALAEGDRQGAEAYLSRVRSDVGELAAARQAAEKKLAAEK
ncbi:MAG: heme biosynthesis HemY N-terminal domain-containing protein [Parasulfuritortus sp.]|nr:heme biosynthesis HemY N-terminal domain-containing protein [Parasulfuritortus sp.]